jgi:MFS family permease
MILVADRAFRRTDLPVSSTVASAHLNDRIDASHRVAAAAALGLIFGIGSIAGPFTASAAMEAFGPRGFFLALASVTGAFGTYVAYRLAVARPLAP